MFIALTLLLGSVASAAPEPADPTAPPSAVQPAADPPPDPCRSDPPDRTSAFEAELERAKTLYRRGCHAWALDLLRDLDVRRRLTPVDAASEIDQRLYLGEVLLVLGRRQEASDAFELLLSDHPTAEMGLLEHDPDAVDLLERIRAALESRLPPTPPELPPLPRRPLWTYTPYGVGHLANKDRGSFLAFGGVQLAFIATTAVTSAIFPRDWKTLRIPKEDDPASFNRLVTLKAINYGAAAGFVVTYAISQASLSREWKRQQRARLQVTPTGARLQGRF